MMIPGFKVTSAKFYYDSLLGRIQRGTKRVSSRFGGYVRTGAKRSLKKGRMKKIGEMSPAELEEYRLASAIAKEKGEPKPKRPRISAKPGEVPKSHKGTLKNFLRFDWIPHFKNPVLLVGAIKAPGVKTKDALQVLGPGGPASREVKVHATAGAGANKKSVSFTRKATKSEKIVKQVNYQGNPYMEPAFNKELKEHMPNMWLDSLL